MNSRAFTFARPEWLGEVASTNDLLKERLAAAGRLPPGTVIAARTQTRGRGRMGTEWVSEAGRDLSFSFFWSGDVEPLAAGTLPMACALGVGDFLAGWGVEARCKWPNDVLAGDGKICGILTEGGMMDGGRFGLVVGIGVNIAAAPGRDGALGRRTAALGDFVEDGVGGIEELLEELLGVMEVRVREWEAGGFAEIRGDLERRLWGVGREVAAKTGAGRVRGVVAGLGDGGELLLRDADGAVRAVASVSAIESGW